MSEEVINNEAAVKENRLIAERKKKLSDIRSVREAYPNNFTPKHFAGDLQDNYGNKSKDDLLNDNVEVSIAGRIVADRGAFLLIQDMSGSIQFYVNRKQLSKELLEERKTWDVGDILGGVGVLHKSGKGDLYIDLSCVQLLTKSLRPLPDNYYGLADKQFKYRRRYVDLIVSEQTRFVFLTRSRLIQAIRGFLGERRFLEVETPMMHQIPGGATAKPFETFHNALGMPLFLRIAPELFLKRLVVGGMDRVFELNRSFRNEGLSTKHNPEFTMLEFYQAYADYTDLMDMIEVMFRTVTKSVVGTESIEYENLEIDFSKAFERLTIDEAICRYTDIEESDLKNYEVLCKRTEDMVGKVGKAQSLGELKYAIFEQEVEDKLEQPTFVTAYPVEVSPLSRANDENPNIVDRFELFIAGREVANGFSELNDPEDQAQRFAQQVAKKDSGDEEAMHFDHDYIRALEYGLPPTAGAGIGIDRLIMLLTNMSSIRDVCLFPHLRPEND